MKFDLRHETLEGRCAWCWNPLPANSTHTAVSPLRPPYFDGRPLRFHHACWTAYKSLSEFGAVAKGTGLEVTPTALEEIRILAGLTIRQICERMRISYERFKSFMEGDPHSLTDTMIRVAKELATETKYGRAASSIDWSQGYAVFSLRMHGGGNKQRNGKGT